MELIIIFVSALGMAVTLFNYLQTNKSDLQRSIIMAVLSVGFFLVAVLGKVYAISEYKRGQIDALTGHVKYELKTQPDKTVEWVEIQSKD